MAHTCVACRLIPLHLLLLEAKAHWGKPIWGSASGAELPLLNSAVAVVLMLTGAGAYSMDEALSIEVPSALTAVALLGARALIGYGFVQKPTPTESAQEEARTTLEGGEAASDSTIA